MHALKQVYSHQRSQTSVVPFLEVGRLMFDPESYQVAGIYYLRN